LLQKELSRLIRKKFSTSAPGIKIK